MKKYIKPESKAISLFVENNVMLTASEANNHKYNPDGSDTDYGTQFSEKGGWSSDDWTGEK